MIHISRLTWEKRTYDIGVDHGVLYPKNSPGVVWNGLVSVQESPSSDQKTRFIDGVKTYRNRGSESFSGTITAFTYPEPFPKTFGMSYRVTNKIHVVYNMLVTPTKFDYRSFETEPFSWNFTTKPVEVPGAKVSAHLIVDMDKAYSSAIDDLTAILYGSDLFEPRLPLPEELLSIFEKHSILQVIDNGDGSFTVIAPEDVLQMIDDTTFQINWPSAVYIDEVSYTLSSL